MHFRYLTILTVKEINKKGNIKYVCISVGGKYQSKSVSVSELTPSKVIFDVSVGW